MTITKNIRLYVLLLLIGSLFNFCTCKYGFKLTMFDGRMVVRRVHCKKP